MKRDIYMISAFLTALAGTFYIQYIYFIDPATAFSFNISIEAALVSIVGGIGTLWGPVIGTVLLETTSTLLQSWLGSSIGGVQLTVYSLILMAVILWRPTGLMGMIDRSLAALSQPQSGAGVEASAMADALVIKGLSKRFGGLRAVQDVSFTMQENETVALIGPNGAGKTTSFHLITGFHRPDSGSVMAYRPRDRGPEAARHLRARPGADLPGRKAVRRHDGARQCHDRRVPARQDMPRWRAKRRARRSNSSASRPGSRPRPRTSPPSISAGWKWRARWRRSRGCCCSTKSWPG